MHDPRTFFVVNDYLWASHRPQRLQICQMTHGLASERSNFNLMMDLNRCMILTTALPAKRFNMDSYFTTLVYDLC